MFFRKKRNQTHKIYLRFVAHETLDFKSLLNLGRIDKCGTSIDIISTQAIDNGLDGLKSTFVENEITREDVHCF